MNKNYRLLSFRSFFIFIFFRGVSPSGFLGGGERLKILYSRRVFLHSDFFLFYTFTLFTFLHFLHFQIFSSKAVEPVWVTPPHIFTFLQFFRGHSSGCFFFMWGDAKKNFFFWGGVAQSGSTALLLSLNV